MSFKPKPPNNPYGDRDFVSEGDETYANQDAGPHVNDNQRPTPPPHGQDFQNQTPKQIGPLVAMVHDMHKAGVITPKDILFMRSYRQDTFYSKTLPIFALSSGSLYFYRKHKGLAQKWWHYLIIGVFASITGPFFNQNEFVRRLERDPASTPYLDALRRSYGVTKRVTEMDREAGGPIEPVVELTDWSRPIPEANQPRYGSDSGPSRSAPPPQPQLEDPNGPKKTMTYDELRAKNRGTSR